MRILCFGDSNTYGYDPRSWFGDRYPAESRWPEILSKQTGWEVVNAGANGREIPRSPDVAQLLAGQDLLLVMLGTNDLLQGVPAEEAAARMEAFLTWVLPYCSNILLVAPPPMKRGAWVPTEKLAAESIRLAEKYKLLSEKLNIPFADPRGWNIDLAFDGVHFTEAGHLSFAAQVKNICRKLFLPLDSPLTS